MQKTRLKYPFATDLESRENSALNAARKGVTAPLQPSKFPPIPSATPPPGSEPRIAPVGRSKAEMGGFNGADFDNEERLRTLESRLAMTEKSNRTLLEEVVRLQKELRVTLQKSEDSIKEEQVNQQQIENNMQLIQDLINKLSSRIHVTEEKLMEERTALSSLVSHTKGVEQAVVASHQSMAVKKDSQHAKIQELTLMVSDMQRSRDQLEKQVYSVLEEMRSVRTKVDNQGIDLTSTVNELKLRARRLEDENKIQLEALRKQGDMYNTSETSTTHLRGQVETRLSELRDVILELRTKQDQEANDRRSLEQQIQMKINNMQQNIVEQGRKREEALHAMDISFKEKEHSSENEKIRLTARMSETVEDVNKRLLAKEMHLRDEIQNKYVQLERMIQQEQQVRQKYEVSLRDENDKRWQTLKQLTGEEALTIKDTFSSERQKSKDAIHKLDESIGLLEKQLAEQKRQSDKVVAAEIKSRKQHEKSTDDKLASVHEKLSLATASLQQAIGGINGSIGSETEKMKSDMRQLIDASEQANTRAMADMDARIQSLKQKVVNMEIQLDGKITEATAILAQNLREKVESISLWQDVTSQTIRELNQNIQGFPNDIFGVEERLKLLKTETDSRLNTEVDSRIREVEGLRHELNLMKNKKEPTGVTQQDLQEVKESVRKLAESVQTVKTVIGMKIQSEQKQREDDVKELEQKVDELERKIDRN